MAPSTDVIPPVQGDMSGWMAMLLAASGLAFAGFLTVLLVVAATRA